MHKHTIAMIFRILFYILFLGKEINKDNIGIQSFYRHAKPILEWPRNCQFVINPQFLLNNCETYLVEIINS